MSRWNNADTTWGRRLFVGKHYYFHALHWHQVMEQMVVKSFPEKMKRFPEKTPCLQTYSFFLVWQHKEVILLFFFHCRILKQKKKLGCCLSVLCTFDTVKNFKLKCCVERALFPTSAGIPPPVLEPASLCLRASPLASYVFPYHMASIVWVRQVRILIEGGYYFIQHRQLFGYFSRAHTIQRAGTIREIMVLQFWD